MSKKMLEQAMVTKELIHVSQVAKKVCLTKAQMMEQLDIIRGLMMMAYPAFYGLGEWEPIKVILENGEEFDEKMDLSDDLWADKSSLWICGKELQAGKLFSDYYGNNEKQKFVVKVQKRGTGAPAREALIDPDTHKKMLSFYHKKSEEQKQLEDDNEDAYMNSAWADSKQLKSSLQGTGGVKWKF